MNYLISWYYRMPFGVVQCDYVVNGYFFHSQFKTFLYPVKLDKELRLVALIHAEECIVYAIGQILLTTTTILRFPELYFLCSNIHHPFWLAPLFREQLRLL